MKLKSYSKKLALIAITFTISSCTSLGMFEDKDAPLQGERISVLELSHTLQPDNDSTEIIIPDKWKNEYWPQSGGYPNHVMQNISFDASELKKIWKHNIGINNTKNIPLTSSPIIANNALFINNNRNELISLDAKTGKLNWRTNLLPQSQEENIINGGVAYSNSHLYSTNGLKELLKLNPQTGEIIKRIELPAPSRAAPTIIGNKIFIQTMDSRTIAISAINNQIIWEHQAIQEGTQLLGSSNPAANRDIVVSAYSSGEIYTLRVENGAVIWSDNISPIRKIGGLSGLGDIKALPVIGNDAIYAISFGGKMIAVDERTGKRIWQKEIGGTQTPYLAAKTIYQLSNDNELVAMNSETGTINWISSLPKFEDEEDREDPITLYGPVMAGGNLLITSNNGIAHKVNPKTGELINQYKIGKELITAPVIANNILYLLANDGTIMAYR